MFTPRPCRPDAWIEDEDELFEVAEEEVPEDGHLWVVGVGQDAVMAFTDEESTTSKS